jgi:hypothetical protein
MARMIAGVGLEYGTCLWRPDCNGLDDFLLRFEGTVPGWAHTENKSKKSKDRVSSAATNRTAFCFMHCGYNIGKYVAKMISFFPSRK